ncbi:MAG: DNA-3-methyladenine glycosylase [Candidatus Midichloria sp.]|nr:MAG: DNA-3-methyladenine glycosylase [Candidatus Midichloria sp.]
MSKKLPYEFYNRHVVEVAKDLLGKKLVFGNIAGIITETEAYRGFDDEASHAFKGSTSRSKIMFGRAGYTYIYMTYGMYYCLNVTAEDVGKAGAVLIRGLKLPEIHLNGPGKLCKYLQITKLQNGIDLINNNKIHIEKGVKVEQYTTTPRIGIKKAVNKPWRFYYPA